MGEKFHHARICEADLVLELSHAATRAVATCSPEPLNDFLARHEQRKAALDAFLVPLDRAAIDEARQQLVRSQRGRVKAAVRALLESTDLEKLPSTVAKTAQAALVRHLGRLASMFVLPGAAAQRDEEFARARVAIASLSAADLSARLRASALEEESYEGERVLLCLNLCAIPGLDHDVGLGAASMEAFVEGAELVERPTFGLEDEPPAELFARVLALHGEYSDMAASELLRDDWMRFAGSFTGYVPPAWGKGEQLVEAAERVRALADDEWPEDEDDYREEVPEELLPAFEEFRQTLLRAERAGHAVVEWVEKF